jgi:hypothetical protein
MRCDMYGNNSAYCSVEVFGIKPLNLQVLLPWSYVHLSNYGIRGPTFVLPTVKYWPLWRLVAVEVVLPVADSEFLVETRVVGTDIRDSTPILVTHVEDLTVVLRIGVEAHSSVRTVESECQVRKVLPPLGLGTGTRGEILHIPLNGTATLRFAEKRSPWAMGTRFRGLWGSF